MSRPVYFTYGRMNPPTPGHALLIEEMIKLGGDAPVYIFTSHSEDDRPKVRPRKKPGKNPLSPTYKKNLLRKVVKKINKKNPPIILSTSKKYNTPSNTNDRIIGTGPLNVIKYLHYKKGFDDLRMVVGSNRIADFNVFKKYLPKNVTLTTIPVGEKRKNNGISGTKARAAAFESDGEFRKCIAEGINNTECRNIRRKIISKSMPLGKTS